MASSFFVFSSIPYQHLFFDEEFQLCNFNVEEYQVFVICVYRLEISQTRSSDSECPIPMSMTLSSVNGEGGASKSERRMDKIVHFLVKAERSPCRSNGAAWSQLGESLFLSREWVWGRGGFLSRFSESVGVRVVGGWGPWEGTGGRKAIGSYIYERTRERETLSLSKTIKLSFSSHLHL
jgi:hypothetical protein